MRRILAIAGQTMTAAMRFRLVVAAALLLAVCIVALPFLVRHNGTARMFAQVMLTYNLTVITGLLAFLTLWLACGALASEVESGQLQLVAVKPVARWQLWLGKWLGIVTLNVILLATSLGASWTLLHWRARDLSAEQQTVLRQEVLVARGSLREAPVDLNKDVEALVRERQQKADAADLDPAMVVQQVRALARARMETVAPNFRRVWTLDLGPKAADLRDQPLHLRALFHSAKGIDSGLFNMVWVVGDVASGRFSRLQKQLAAGVTHEFAIPPGLIGADGRLNIECENRGDTTLLFRLDGGLELLYPAGGFTPNLVRGAGVILCWLALLAAVGLAASSLLSFPSAAIVSLSVLYLGLSGGSFSEAVSDGSVFGFDHETNQPTARTLDTLLLPLYRVLNLVVNSITVYSPISDLSTGRAVGWDTLFGALAQIVLLTGGLFAAIGIVALTRRQLGLPNTTP